MAKKQYCLIVDCETTQDNLVADFAAVIADRKGNIHAQCAVLTNEIYTDSKNHPLFFTSDTTGIWSKLGQDSRYKQYARMLESGSRMIASIGAINRWLDKAKAGYDPYLTAYNLPFDLDKCEKTGIDLTPFHRRFCLWAAAYTKWGKSKKFKEFILSAHAFNTPTELGNMTYKTNAEIMARFVLNNNTLPDEPHTALEDIIGYELPIFTKLARTEKMVDLCNSVAYDWRQVQVKDHFKAK